MCLLALCVSFFYHYTPERSTLFLNLNRLELSYRFQTLHDDSYNSTTLKSLSESPHVQLKYADYYLFDNFLYVKII